MLLMRNKCSRINEKTFHFNGKRTHIHKVIQTKNGEKHTYFLQFVEIETN